MEEIDRAIIAALTADGRLSYTDLAERVGLSVSAVHQRVRRLEQRGVITGYVARVAYDAIGLPLTAFVAIRPLDPSQPDDAPERLSHLPEIESCYSVAGEDFYLLLVRVASPADLERLLQEIRGRPTSRPARRWCCPPRTRTAHPKSLSQPSFLGCLTGSAPGYRKTAGPTAGAFTARAAGAYLKAGPQPKKFQEG